jgi:serine/threonine-protein kinase
LPAELVLGRGTLLAGKYRLDRPAGFGGMAQLWVATNASTAAEVCVKILVPESDGDEAAQRFRREAHAAAKLSHRAIVRVFDLVELDVTGEAARGTVPAALAIVMELLGGETLGDALMKRGKLPVEETFDIIIPVLSALGHAHRAGVVHRDIKPDNVFLAKDPDGHVTPKVLDFGISKLQGDKAQLTNDGVMLGTPSFMSPEQARGASKVDARSDVFSAAILLVMMLTGKNPFDDDSFHAVMSAILTREVERVPEAPDALWAVLQKALSKDPAARYADATELGIAVRRAAGRQIVTESGTDFRPLLDSVVTVPPVTTGTPGQADEALEASGVDDEDDDATGLPTKRSPLPLLAAVVAAAFAVAVVLVLRAVSAPRPALETRETHARSGAASTAGALAAPPPATSVPPLVEVAPMAAAPAAESVAAPSASGAPMARPRPVGASSKPAPKPTKRPPAPAAPVNGREPAIVRDPGF